MLPWTKDPALARARADLRERIAGFCDAHLSAEYRTLCLKLLDAWLRLDPGGAVRGKPEVTAAAVVHAIGSANDLFYAERGPRLTTQEIADGFGVSVGGMNTRSLAIRRTLDDAGVEPDGFFTRQTRRRAEAQDDLLTQIGALMGVAPDGEFVDDDHPVMSGYYDLMDRCQGRVTPAVQKQLRQLIALDPDFYDSYLALAEAVGGTAGRKLVADAYARADARIPGSGSIDWGFLENRHILRTLCGEGIARWEEGDTGGAATLFARLLAHCPNDNIGARYLLLALREGMTYESYLQRYGDDYRKEIDWFDAGSARYPDDFAAWRKIVDGDRG